MIRVYLDTCALQRPLDTKSHLRIALESEAVLGLMGMWEARQIQFIFSDAHKMEMEKNKNVYRREYALDIISRADLYISLTESIETRASALLQFGISPLDSLHLAFAESDPLDFFCTCDDELIKKSKRVKDLKTRLILPLDLVKEIEK